MTPQRRATAPSARDAFVSYASEDKCVAQQLTDALHALGFSVWFDEYELKVGDSLSRRIDEGLGMSRCGIVILSHNFFAKEWPRSELGGLKALERRILPIWHELDANQVKAFSPTLADIRATKTSLGMNRVAQDIAEVLRGQESQAALIFPDRAFETTPSQPAEQAFRKAQMELWKNIQHISEWSHLQERPSKRWSAGTLTFAALEELLVTASVPQELWYRITTVIRNIQAYATRVDDAVTKGEGDVREAREWNRIIDLYLKQLACYLFAEMRRQALQVPKDWASQPMCEPLAWIYQPRSPTPEAAALMMEGGGTFPPHVPFAAEPSDSAFDQCKLEKLIVRAREKSALQQARLRATGGGWVKM